MQSSLPAGWLTFTGRELNPLDRYKRFQITFSSPFSGFILAQEGSSFISRTAWRFRAFLTQYFQASDGSVALPAAGYDYDIDWTSYVGGTCTRWNGS